MSRLLPQTFCPFLFKCVSNKSNNKWKCNTKSLEYPYKARHINKWQTLCANRRSQEKSGKRRDKCKVPPDSEKGKIFFWLHRKTQAFILTVIIGVFPSSAVAARPGGQLSAQLAGALALSATAFSPGQVEWARAGLAAAASLQVVRVEAAGRWWARAARRRAAAAQATPSPAATVFVAGGRGADRALQGGGAAWGDTGAAVVVRRAR